MLVISHAPFQGALPQPSGPSIKAEDVKVANTSYLKDGSLAENQSISKAGARKRTMARSTSMFQEPTRRSISSRSTSPLSSAPSTRTSRSANLLSTPASTVLSDGTNGKSSASARKKRGVKLEPVVEIDTTKMPGKLISEMITSEDPAAIPYEVPVDIAMPSFARKSTKQSRDFARVWEAVAGARRITVICGAGISVSSPANIPDFRSTAGLFRKLKEKHPNAGLTSGKDLFDASLFNSAATSSIFYSMIAELKAMADAASPTTFHHLLKRLDLEGRLQRVYTQNIDGLEERAGLTFGLGESGDSRATLRALGKRKRDLQKSPASRAGSFARSKSDSAVLFSQREEAQLRLSQEVLDKMPMFPRTIPLHGSLSTMTCTVCNYKIYLSLASSGPSGLSVNQREYSPDAPDQAIAAMDLLSQGEAVACVKCQDYERVRSVAGLRSRGVGIMKVDVVLYNGQNNGAEQVGDCVQRDILGLRDPNETGVPESLAEKMARERKEKKEREKEERLQPISEATSAEEALAFGFSDVEGGVAGAEQMSWQPTTPKKKPARVPRLKPLPPDLLIVAGTSLKVPGTKRIVREFAKACHARDHRVYPDSDESEEEDDCIRQTRSKSRSKSIEENAEDDEEEEEEDINAPIRTILLNYDFPVPPSSWEGVFDVWVQGDVQQSALGLWEASKYPVEDCIGGFSMKEDEHHALPLPQLSWSSLLQELLDERKALKKAASKKSSSQQQAEKTPPNSATVKSPSSSQKTAKEISKGKATMVKSEKEEAIVKSPKKVAKTGASKAVKETKATSKAQIKKSKDVPIDDIMHATKKSTTKTSKGKKPSA